MIIDTMIEQAVSEIKQYMLHFCQEAAEAPLTRIFHQVETIG